MKCEYGLCTHCEKKIMDTCPTCSAKKPNGQYTEVLMPLTTGSKMPVAVCLECKDTVWHTDKKALMKVVRDAWHKEHDNMKWTKAQRDAYWSKHGEGILEIA